jgi:hypothetical protein
MSREKLRSKYGMSKQRPVSIPPDKGMRGLVDSAAVVRLSEFIQANRQHGIHLVIKAGWPALRFVPGLNKGNAERWDACLAAEVLLFKAAPDLMKLIEQEKMANDEPVSFPTEHIHQEKLL